MHEDLTHFDLCSGIGGFALAAQWAGFRTVGFAEVNPYCCRLLAQHWPGVPNLGDLRLIDRSAIRTVHLLTAGYPCQPFSTAGKRGGAADDRHLWPALRELLPYFRPAWLCFENVAGHISLGLDQVLADLEGLGYTAQPLVIPACAVGAWHRRDRVWIIAHADKLNGDHRRHDPADVGRLGQKPTDAGQERDFRVDSHSHGDDGHRRGGNVQMGRIRRAKKVSRPLRPSRDQRCSEPKVGRVAYGVPGQMDKLTALGNSIYPEIACRIFEAIRATTEQMT